MEVFEGQEWARDDSFEKISIAAAQGVHVAKIKLEGTKIREPPARDDIGEARASHVKRCMVFDRPDLFAKRYQGPAACRQAAEVGGVIEEGSEETGT